jgi:hypothetical protein
LCKHIFGAAEAAELLMLLMQLTRFHHRGSMLYDQSHVPLCHDLVMR